MITVCDFVVTFSKKSYKMATELKIVLMYLNMYKFITNIMLDTQNICLIEFRAFYFRIVVFNSNSLFSYFYFCIVVFNSNSLFSYFC